MRERATRMINRTTIKAVSMTTPKRRLPYSSLNAIEGAAVLLGALALSEEVAFIVSGIKRFLIQLCSSQSRPGQESRALPIPGPLARNKLPWLEALPVVVEDRRMSVS
jgi:hypothetical protein